MPSDDKKERFCLLLPLGKEVDKLWRKEKKLLSAFRGVGSEDWGFGLNLGSLCEVLCRADTARQIARRADARRRLVTDGG
ncbi:MAG: hypothetical protein G8237_11400 [Magnetococcales bacterium]|nr:hypothetical protein [Magnetococcales bacterium]